jgi:hypothetical protein
MRLLIYGMQSSGASTLALVLAQNPQCAAFVDIWTMYAAPSLSGPEDVVAKVVVTTAFPLSLHQERFRPDRTILVLRHPVANYRSLAAKPYRHECGFIEEKFAVLDRVFADRSSYDALVHFEDLVFDPLQVLHNAAALGWPCGSESLTFSRRPADIVAFNEARFPVVKERLGYGIGNYRGGGIKKEFAQSGDLTGESPVADWCPRVAAHYRDLLVEREGSWRFTPARRGGGTTARRMVRRAPPFAAGGGEGRATADRIRLDQYWRGESSSHLDLSIFALGFEAEAWPHVKFKFCRSTHGPHLEFREMTGWPVMFAEFPGTAQDSYGTVCRLAVADLTALAAWRTDRDRQLVRAIATLLSRAVAAALAQQRLPAAEHDEWLAEARAFSAKCLRALRGSGRAASIRLAAAAAQRDARRSQRLSGG